MIRKILLLSVLIAIALWVAGAHIVKSKVVDFASRCSSDNIKLQFQDAKISGFPFGWKIKLVSPKITIVNHNSLKELSAGEMILSFSYSLGSVKMNLGKMFAYNEADNDISRTHKLASEQDINLDISFSNSLFFANSNSDWKDQLKSVSAAVSQLSDSLEDKEVFSLNAIELLSTREKNDASDILRVKLFGDYSSNIGYMKMNKAHLLLDLSYHENLEKQTEKVDFERKFELSNFQLKFDNAAIDVKGFLKLSRSSLPSGKLDLSIHQYHDVVDTLIPDDFIFSKSFLKKVISKAAASELNKDDIGNANFKIIFSDKGVTVGKLSIAELQAE